MSTTHPLRKRYGYADASPRWRLIRIYDVRPIDFYTGKRVPVSDVDDLPECTRCGRRHAKVYVVQDRDNPERVSHVGSGCCKRAFDGWEPTAVEVKSARAAEREQLAANREAKVTELARPIVEAMLAVKVPEPRRLEIKPVWADRPDGEQVEVWGTERHHVTCYRGFDEERRRAYESQVREEVARPMLNAVPKTLWSEVYHMVAKLYSAARRSS